MSPLDFNIGGTGAKNCASVVLNTEGHRLNLGLLDKREILELVKTLQQASVDLLDYVEVPT